MKSKLLMFLCVTISAHYIGCSNRQLNCKLLFDGDVEYCLSEQFKLKEITETFVSEKRVVALTNSESGELVRISYFQEKTSFDDHIGSPLSVYVEDLRKKEFFGDIIKIDSTKHTFSVLFNSSDHSRTHLDILKYNNYKSLVINYSTPESTFNDNIFNSINSNIAFKNIEQRMRTVNFSCANPYIVLSPYHYTMSNPLNSIDPDGRYTLTGQAAQDALFKPDEIN